MSHYLIYLKIIYVTVDQIEKINEKRVCKITYCYWIPFQVVLVRIFLEYCGVYNV